jgi:hypothetical protein
MTPKGIGRIGILLLTVLLWQSAVRPGEAADAYSRVVTFGDSLVDSGNPYVFLTHVHSDHDGGLIATLISGSRTTVIASDVVFRAFIGGRDPYGYCHCRLGGCGGAVHECQCLPEPAEDGSGIRLGGLGKCKPPDVGRPRIPQPHHRSSRAGHRLETGRPLIRALLAGEQAFVNTGRA